MNQPADKADVIVVGAGIVGICSAVLLAEAGKKVVVLDRTGVCEETSSGNAAALAFTDMLPMAHKGMGRQVPKWLADPLGPLAIPPAYLPKLMPWLIRFVMAGRPGRYEASLTAQASMMKLAEREWNGLFDRSGTRSMLRSRSLGARGSSRGRLRTSSDACSVALRVASSTSKVRGRTPGKR